MGDLNIQDLLRANRDAPIYQVVYFGYLFCPFAFAMKEEDLDNPELRNWVMEVVKEIGQLRQEYDKEMTMTQAEAKEQMVAKLKQLAEISKDHEIDRICFPQPWVRKDDGLPAAGQTIYQIALEARIPIWLNFMQEHAKNAKFIVWQDGVNLPSLQHERNRISDMKLFAYLLEFNRKLEAERANFPALFEWLDKVADQMEFSRIRLTTKLDTPEHERISKAAEDALSSGKLKTQIFYNCAHPDA